MGQERWRLGAFVIRQDGELLTLRRTYKTVAPSGLGVSVFAAACAAAAYAVWLRQKPENNVDSGPLSWAPTAIFGTFAVLLLAAGVGRVLPGLIPIALDRRDRSARHGPRQLGQVEGVYLRAVISSGGDRYTLYLRRTGRPAYAIRPNGRREPMQKLAVKVSHFLEVPWHQGPGKPR